MNLSKAEKTFALIFALLSAWWAVLYFAFGAQLEQQNLYWAATYQLLAWGGGIYGLTTASSWGGFRSWMGKAVIFFSIGLLLQGFGQTTFSIYTTLLHVDIPYPSIADIGYFGSIFFYIAGIVSVAKVSGVSVRLRNAGGKLQALLIPAIMLVLSYAIFLRGYEFDWTQPLKILLDFGYPLGEALYVAIAILALILSRDILGGIMRKPLLFLMMALVVQYFADFNFLYQALNNSWINGGYGDFIYLFAYFLMAVSLANIQRALWSHRSDATA